MILSCRSKERRSCAHCSSPRGVSSGSGRSWLALERLWKPCAWRTMCTVVGMVGELDWNESCRVGSQGEPEDGSRYIYRDSMMKWRLGESTCPPLPPLRSNLAVPTKHTTPRTPCMGVDPAAGRLHPPHVRSTRRHQRRKGGVPDLGSSRSLPNHRVAASSSTMATQR